MRQIIIQVPRGQGQRVLQLARDQDARHVVQIEAADGTRELDLLLVHVDNDRMESLLHHLQSMPDLRLVLRPHGVILLEPPTERAPEQVTDVAPRSPIEIFLGGLQSVGSWRGFIGYAVAAGVVAWIGLFTERSYLLVAAMLIAPYAGPAMNTALATARGDAVLLRRALLRYVVSLLITIVVALLLSLAMRQDIATELMVQQSMLSSVAVLLPLVAGAAGALNLCQSERNSLVSGAATGMLIAASLAPPAALVGMATAIGEWAMALSGAFVLVLQLVGINASGAVLFRLFGLTPRGARYERGKASVSRLAWSLSMMLLAAMLMVQLWKQPDLQRSSRQQRAAADLQRIIDESGIAKLIEADVRFTRADIPSQNTLLAIVYVQPSPQTQLEDDAIRQRLREQITSKLMSYNVVPLVEVNVLRPGDAPDDSLQ